MYSSSKATTPECGNCLSRPSGEHPRDRMVPSIGNDVRTSRSRGSRRPVKRRLATYQPSGTVMETPADPLSNTLSVPTRLSPDEHEVSAAAGTRAASSAAEASHLALMPLLRLNNRERSQRRAADCESAQIRGGPVAALAPSVKQRPLWLRWRASLARKASARSYCRAFT
jgi:hypothetical protein